MNKGFLGVEIHIYRFICAERDRYYSCSNQTSNLLGKHSFLASTFSSVHSNMPADFDQLSKTTSRNLTTLALLQQSGELQDCLNH